MLIRARMLIDKGFVFQSDTEKQKRKVYKICKPD